jgi:SAM-dependent methyltransferase
MKWALAALPKRAHMSAGGSNQITVRTFDRLDEFVSFYRQSPQYFDRQKIQQAAEHIRRNGIFCNVYEEAVPASEIVIDSNYRESIVYRSFSSRLRAVYHVFHNASRERSPDSLKIFAPEAVTPFALFMRGRFPKFLGSEYSTDPALKSDLFPILVEDLHALSFPDRSFDFAIVNEVFEHVPFLDTALAELARILKVGGTLISTFPFLALNEESVIRARLVNGKIEHLMEPEYHGNPVDLRGSLVFEIPGWNIARRVRQAGFTTATFVWVQSVDCGILASGYGGIIVLVARK